MKSAIALLSAVALGTGAAIVSSVEPTAQAAPTRSLIMSAFGDAQGTFGESRPFIKKLQNPTDRTSESVFCNAVVEGMLSNQPVTVIATGSGEQNSGACMQEMLNWYSPGITEVIWSGIAGFSPAVGGLVDNSGLRRKGAKPVMVGDVCVSALSWNYDLTLSSVDDWYAKRTPKNRYGSSGGWWSLKRSDGKERLPGFEDVQQFVIAERALADEVTAASRDVTWPKKSKGVKRKIKRFFSPSQIRATKVYDTTQCGEVSANDFWVGATEDQLARKHLASLISASGYSKSKVTKDDVVVASAMEASGWMSTMHTWNSAKKLSIPMVVVRAASDYDQVPLNKQGNPVNGPDGKPLSGIQDIREGFRTAGADYAIRNAAAPVLKMFEQRAER